MTNEKAIILLNMFVFEKEKHCLLLEYHILYVFFRVLTWPKIGIFLGLGFNLTFGPPPPPSYFCGSPDPGAQADRDSGNTLLLSRSAGVILSPIAKE